MRTWMGRFATWYVIGYLVLVAGIAFSVWLAVDAGQERDWYACLRGNDTRRATRSAFDAYTQALIAASTASIEAETPEERDERDRAIERFQVLVDQKLANLRPAACGPRP